MAVEDARHGAGTITRESGAVLIQIPEKSLDVGMQIVTEKRGDEKGEDRSNLSRTLCDQILVPGEADIPL